MTRLARLFRKRLALRSAGFTLLAVAVLGIASLTGAILVSESRERDRQYERLEELLTTVERTVQIACFLDDKELAAEVANGLLSNRIVGSVTVVQGSNVLAAQGTAGTGHRSSIERAIMSPFVPEEQVCSVELTPNDTEISRSVMRASLFTGVVLSLQLIAIGAVVVWVILRMIIKPITSVSRRLRALAPESGEQLRTPPGNQDDELGHLVGSVNGMIERLVRSIHDERSMRLQREVDEKRFRAIFENVETGIFELNNEGRMLSANPAFRRLFNIRPELDLNQQPIHFADLAGEAREQVEDELMLLVNRGRPCRMELKLESGEYPRWVSILLNSFEEGRLQGVANDVTERQLAAHAAEHMAVTDLLTGIGNRRGLMMRLDQSMRIVESDPGYKCALVMLDLDRFKQANDTYGHAVGDKVLHHVASLLTELVRQADYVCRLGGDEFVVLLEGTARREDIERVLDRFLERVNQPIGIEPGIEVSIGASLGVAILDENAQSAEDVLQRADSAMYQAKHAGRNCYRFHS
ncbi:diguanylate cyclase [Pseudomonas sp. gcc21]|uniref:sensor domain-containing diguanylate cyclase n=1 Tax=Pseudomonas sp. gcc21 TaxID=2726989 RepID=UPI001451EF7A|nr:sensor domain-containing diguanylate cyclase [Pseudomonas sp. gcc21]QJD59716.1 diguanylate cyclase [Pseudomonas sp. gcc21]